MERALRIEIGCGEGQGTLRVSAPPPRSPATLLIGKRPEDALRVLPLQFNLCPMAHGTAAALALGLTVPPGNVPGLAGEILREHALVMLRDWPLALGGTPDAEALKGLITLSPARLDRLELDLFGMSAQAWLERGTPARTDPDTPALAALREVASWPADHGRAPLAGDPTYLVRCMREDDVIAAAADTAAPGLHLRMLARMREAARLVVEIREGAVNVRCGLAPDGGAWAEAARGKLRHRATLSGERIAAYSIATPTDSMTAPGGFLAQLLGSALRAPSALRRKAFAIALSCADPCIEVDIAAEAA
jgi:hypothetical protein